MIIRCERHEVVAAVRLDSAPIVEGHADLLGGTCGNCGQTLVGQDVGNGKPVNWLPVFGIVTRQRYLRRAAAFAAVPVDPQLTNAELLPVLMVEGMVSVTVRDGRSQ